MVCLPCLLQLNLGFGDLAFVVVIGMGMELSSNYLG